MRSHWLITAVTVAALAVLLGVPFVLRPPRARLQNPLTLVVLSPHDEGVKAEFERAFSDWHQVRFGQPVRIDWPNIGGAGDIFRYVQSRFAPEFRKALGDEPATRVNWPAVDRPTTAPDSELTRNARRHLRQVGIDIDVYFGGGEFEHSRFKWNGWTVPADLAGSDYLQVVPATLNGVRLYDKDGYWFGAVLTRVGIIANRLVCDRLGVPVPRTWADLADPRFREQLALADPNFSGSARLCYEMVLQRHGWDGGWPLLTGIAAHARYFGASSTQAALDVSRCEAAAGMIIDYYGRTQVNFVGADRLEYTSPAGATATTPDPIAVMRGAPHPELAGRFVRFVLAPEGQKLWMGRVGSPGGPAKFPLYRPPIRPDIYETFSQHMLVRENPFAEPTRFNMDAAMQGRRFSLLGVLMRAAFIDNGGLLRQAADAARAAGPHARARELLEALPFEEGDPANPAPGTMWHLADRYNKANELEREKIADELTGLFREKYQRVLAAAGQ